MTVQVAVASDVLRIAGRVDHGNGTAVCAEGKALLTAHAGVAGVDLNGVDRPGSVLVAVLLVWAAERATPLRLHGVTSSLRRVLEFTGMDELFELADS